MKERERKAMIAVYEALGCPMPTSGSRTTSISGLSQFAAEMREILPQCRRVLVTLGGGESYTDELSDDVADLNEIVKRQTQVRQAKEVSND